MDDCNRLPFQAVLPGSHRPRHRLSPDRASIKDGLVTFAPDASATDKLYTLTFSGAWTLNVPGLRETDAPCVVNVAFAGRSGRIDVNGIAKLPRRRAELDI